MSMITEPQKKLIAIASEAPLIKNHFWLAGGTALAEFYLKHRKSRDLDFFTDSREDFKTAVREFESTAQKTGIELDVDKKTDTFARYTCTIDDEAIKVEFCVDAPYRFQPTVESPLGIRVENSIDIACNKLSALYDRFEIRDYVDVYFIHKEMCGLDKLIPWAKQKHGGMVNQYLAIAFNRIKDVPEDFPMFPDILKHLDKKDMRETFLRYAARLINEPFEARPYSK